MGLRSLMIFIMGLIGLALVRIEDAK